MLTNFRGAVLSDDLVMAAVVADLLTAAPGATPRA